MRRADPNKRDRTQPRPKAVTRVDDNQSASKDKMDSRLRGNDGSGDVGRAGARTDARPDIEKRAEKPNMDSRLRGNDERAAKPDAARQRNHRFDGKQHGEPFAQNIAGEKPETERPLRSNLRAESAGESKSSEFKPGEFKPRNVESRPAEPDSTNPQALIRAPHRALIKTSRNIVKRRVVVARCAMVMMRLLRRNMARRLGRLINLRLLMWIRHAFLK